MPISRIASWAATALPYIAIVLALANWIVRTDRASAWTVVIVISVAMIIVRHLSRLAMRRASGDAFLVRNFGSVTGAVTIGALVMIVPLAVTLAGAHGVVSDPDLGRRATMIVIGVSLAATGNALPRMLAPVSSLRDNAARVQGFQRMTGWTWVIGGLGFATAWLALPIAAAMPVSIGLVATAIVITMIQLVRIRKPSRHAPSVS